MQHILSSYMFLLEKKIFFSKPETMEENPLPLSDIVSGEPGIKLNSGYWTEFSTPDIL